jgi:hypothetical protein
VANTRAKRHIHKYYKVQMGAVKVWACALGDCNHYMPYHMNNMMNGKFSICWQCGKDMVLHPGNLEDDMPRCDACKLGVTREELLDIVDTPLFGKTKLA